MAPRPNTATSSPMRILPSRTATSATCAGSVQTAFTGAKSPSGRNWCSFACATSASGPATRVLRDWLRFRRGFHCACLATASPHVPPDRGHLMSSPLHRHSRSLQGSTARRDRCAPPGLSLPSLAQSNLRSWLAPGQLTYRRLSEAIRLREEPSGYKTVARHPKEAFALKRSDARLLTAAPSAVAPACADPPARGSSTRTAGL